MTAQVAINLNLSNPQVGSGFLQQKQATNLLSGGLSGMAGGSGMGGVAGKAGLIGMGIAGVSSAFEFLEKTTLRLIESFTSAVTTFGQFSPDVQAAKGKQSALDIQADIRRAKETGPDLAQFVTAQSELNRTIEDIKGAFLKPFLKVTNTIMTDLNELLKVVGPAVQFTGEVLAEMFEFIRWTLTELVKLLKHIPGIAALAEEMKQKWDRQTMGNDIGMEINRFLDPAMQEGYSLPRSKPEPQPPEADFFPATS